MLAGRWPAAWRLRCLEHPREPAGGDHGDSRCSLCLALASEGTSSKPSVSKTRNCGPEKAGVFRQGHQRHREAQRGLPLQRSPWRVPSGQPGPRRHLLPGRLRMVGGTGDGRRGRGSRPFPVSVPSALTPPSHTQREAQGTLTPSRAGTWRFWGEWGARRNRAAGGRRGALRGRRDEPGGGRHRAGRARRLLKTGGSLGVPIAGSARSQARARRRSPSRRRPAAPGPGARGHAAAGRPR